MIMSLALFKIKNKDEKLHDGGKAEVTEKKSLNILSKE